MAGDAPDLKSAEINIETIGQLRRWHLQQAGRRDPTAIDIASAWYLASQILVGGYGRILELGSGFSSLVMRWAVTRCGHGGIWTVETEFSWLDQTHTELEALGLPTIAMHLWDELVLNDLEGEFDFVFLDAGDTRWRKDRLVEVCQMVSPFGELILDDMHLEHYGPEVMQALRWAGWMVDSLEEETLDKHGRFMAVAWRRKGLLETLRERRSITDR